MNSGPSLRMNSGVMLVVFALFMGRVSAQGGMPTVFETSRGTQTVTYEQGIAYLQQLDKAYKSIKLLSFGTTDAGKPLHLAILSADGKFDLRKASAQGKTILLVNNAIHPGEPDGVDASLLLLRDLASDASLRSRWQDVVVCVIPFYNIGGVLNRGSYSRANQNGPEAYGFRGNAKNYDLNRDFIKQDSKNAAAFAQIFHFLQPDLFLDNHVSNGADYPYTMTYIVSQKDKLGSPLAPWMMEKMLPSLEANMKKAHFEMTPYVSSLGETPDEKGLEGFLETPRYSSGYAALFHTPGFIVETHMLKPYADRVKGTYAFMWETIQLLQQTGKELQQLRKVSAQKAVAQDSFALRWELDTSRFDSILFKGYEAEYQPSKVTTGNRLFYNRDKPFARHIPYYNNYRAATTASRPKAYFVPAQWDAVIDRLRTNGIHLEPVTRSRNMNMTVYYIDSYKTATRAYEGHYPHYDTRVRRVQEEVTIPTHGYWVYCNQPGNRYIVETLEPEAGDSFFNWNFFDPILMQKEHFSDYVFEDIAADLLAKDPALKKRFDDRLQTDEAFRKNPAAQLDFIYRHSPYYERTHLRYPVMRWEEDGRK